MVQYRDDFQKIYKYVKTYCETSDSSISTALHVSVDSVRQYSGKRKTIPDDVSSLCNLFEDEINKLKIVDKRTLLKQISEFIPDIDIGIKDDEIAQYICAMLKKFASNGKSQIHSKNSLPQIYEPTGTTQAIIFDFDGTLTKTKSHTTWEELWKLLGYSVKECQELHSRYDCGEFTHPEWCDKTAEKFIEKGLKREQLIELSKKIQLIAGCKKTLEKLKENNIKLYIVSGSIKDIIENVLGTSHKYFTEIKANEFMFDTKTSVLKKIIGTKYDFEGKADYIRYIAKKLQISTSDILFVGNSNNDIWAYQSGADTLCINPTLTNYHDNKVWHNTIVDCKNLMEILPFVK